MSAKNMYYTSILYIRDRTIKEITLLRSRARRGKEKIPTTGLVVTVMLYYSYLSPPSHQKPKGQQLLEVVVLLTSSSNVILLIPLNPSIYDSCSPSLIPHLPARHSFSPIAHFLFLSPHPPASFDILPSYYRHTVPRVSPKRRRPRYTPQGYRLNALSTIHTACLGVVSGLPDQEMPLRVSVVTAPSILSHSKITMGTVLTTTLYVSVTMRPSLSKHRLHLGTHSNRQPSSTLHLLPKERRFQRC